MSKEYPYEVRDPQQSMEWTVVNDTHSAWASARAFIKLKGYKAREFVDAPRVFEVRHPYTDPAAIHEVRVSVPLRAETDVRHHGAAKWTRVGRRSALDEALAELERLRACPLAALVRSFRGDPANPDSRGPVWEAFDRVVHAVPENCEEIAPLVEAVEALGFALNMRLRQMREALDDRDAMLAEGPAPCS